MSKFEKIVTVEPSYNKIHSDPSKNYGIGDCRVRFVLKGDEGAVQFMIGTGWYVESARRHLDKFPVRERDIENMRKPMGWDVGYHWPKPMYEGQTPMGKCDLLPEGNCYYDGSSLRADSWVEDFMAGGTDWLWKKLEEEYYERLNQAQREA